MKYIFVALFVIVQLWTVSAIPIPEGESTPSSVPSFEESVAKARDTVKSVSDHLSEMVGLPKIGEANSVYDAFKTSGNDLVKNLSETVDKIKSYTDTSKNGEVSAAVKSVQENLEKSVEHLKKQFDSPEMKEKNKQIQENFAKTLSDIVEQAGKLSKSFEADAKLPEGLKSLGNKIVDEAVSAANQVQAAVHEATGHKKEDSHDHAAHEHAAHQH